MGMGHSMNRIPSLFPVIMPIIKKQVVKHSGPGSAPGIQVKKFTDPVIIICHIQAVLVTAGSAVMGVFLHLQHCRVMYQIFYISVKLFIFRIFYCAFSSFFAQEKTSFHRPYSLFKTFTGRSISLIFRFLFIIS